MDQGAPAVDRLVTRPQMLQIAEQWDADQAGVATHYCVSSADIPDIPGREQAERMAERWRTGVAVFVDAHGVHMVQPPFPIDTAASYTGWNAGPLVDLLERRRRVAVVLLRLGRYAVGLYDGQDLVSSKTGTRLVKGRHKKGGSSSGRFARRREEQAHALFDKVCMVLWEQLEMQTARPEHLLLGGERQTLNGFWKQCESLRGLEDVHVARTLDIREPSRKELEELPRQMYQSRLVTVYPQE